MKLMVLENRRLVAFVSLLVFVLACGDDDTTPDDSGVTPRDAATMDSGPSEDAAADGGSEDAAADAGEDAGEVGCDLNCMNGLCVDAATPACECDEGWTGVLCETDIDECAGALDDCSEMASCTNNDGGFDCECETPFVGDGRSCECPTGTTGDDCTECDEGYARHSEGGCAPEQILTIIIDGDGRGVVTIEGHTTECTETCEIAVADGDTLTITASPGATTAVESWSNGDCSSDECEVSISGDTSITLSWQLQHNIIFASSMMVAPGDIGSISAADSLCSQMASDAGLHASQWIALLASSGPCPDESTTNCDGFERLERAGARGWVNTQGQPVADTVEQMRDDRVMWYPVRYDETGGGGDEDHICVTGLNGLFEVGGTCTDYTDNNMDSRASWGRAGAGDRTVFAQNSNLRCNRASSVYCMSTDHNAQLAAPSETGRRAFVTASTFVISDGGIDSADALCQREACDAGLTGSIDCEMDLGSDATFKALLETNEATAGSRFDSSGEDYVRMDGVLYLLASQLDIAETANLLAISPLNQQADGTLDTTTLVWTGAEGFTCDNWTDPMETGDVGGVENIFFHMSNASARDCSLDAFSLICLEE